MTNEGFPLSVIITSLDQIVRLPTKDRDESLIVRHDVMTHVIRIREAAYRMASELDALKRAAREATPTND